ncbi:MAG: class I SAM-dependent RNA methyltransferase, partial [Chloroflexi bacterium]
YPVCPHFGPGGCWGCQWQHIDYEAQLLLKQDVLADQLSRLGKFDDKTLLNALLPPIPAPLQYGYSYQFTLERDADGIFGLPRMDGRTIKPIAECHIVHPDILALYEQVELDYPNVKRVRFQMGTDGEGAVLLWLEDEEAPEITADISASVNVILPDNEPMNLIGDAHNNYDVLGRNFRVTAGSAFRANVFQLENLVGAVLAALDIQPDDAILDLYAGVGLFSAFAAQEAALVTLVESYPPAATDAETNTDDLDNVDVIEGGVETVLPLLEEQYTAAIVDPSTQGLSREALEGLTALGLQRIVYVSSDPAILARDARLLVRHGYHLAQLQLVDMAPQTYYVDTVALFVQTN